MLLVVALLAVPMLVGLSKLGPDPETGEQLQVRAGPVLGWLAVAWLAILWAVHGLLTP